MAAELDAQLRHEAEWYDQAAEDDAEGQAWLQQQVALLSAQAEVQWRAPEAPSWSRRRVALAAAAAAAAALAAAAAAAAATAAAAAAVAVAAAAADAAAAALSLIHI